MKETVKCLYCGKPFEIKRRDRVYCSTLCCTHDWQEKHPRISIKRISKLTNTKTSGTLSKDTVANILDKCKLSFGKTTIGNLSHFVLEKE